MRLCLTTARLQSCPSRSSLALPDLAQVTAGEETGQLLLKDPDAFCHRSSF